MNIEELVRDAVARYEAMTRDEQQAMRRAQRRSWVVGEMLLEHPEKTREEVERIYDEVVSE